MQQQVGAAAAGIAAAGEGGGWSTSRDGNHQTGPKQNYVGSGYVCLMDRKQLVKGIGKKMYQVLIIQSTSTCNFQYATIHGPAREPARHVHGPARVTRRPAPIEPGPHGPRCQCDGSDRAAAHPLKF